MAGTQGLHLCMYAYIYIFRYMVLKVYMMHNMPTVSMKNVS